MQQIVDVHHPNLDATLLDQVLIKFYWLREQSELRKKPSTSELIDWIAALLRSGVTQQQVEPHIPFLGDAAQERAGRRRARSATPNGGGALPRKWADLGPQYSQ